MILLLKIILPSVLVAFVSLAGRRWGLKVGGAIGGFPVVVGPILFFFSLEQGTAFAARAALRSLWGMLPFSIFCLTLSWTGLRLGLALSMALGWAAFLLSSWVGLQQDPSLASAVVLASGSGSLARLGLPKDRRQGDREARPSNWDIPLRMVVTVLLVLAVTGAAHALGPEWSGVLAAFPVATSTLAGFAYVSDGPFGPPALLQGSLLGGFSYVAFCAALAYSLPRFSLGIAFLSAFALAAGVQIAALSLDRAKR